MSNNDKPIELFKCPICGGLFYTKAQCLKDMKNHDGERDVAIVSLSLYADGWKISKCTKRLPKGLLVNNVVIQRDVNSWRVDVENDEKSILDAKKRLKATALRWYRGQAGRLAKLDIEEKD